MTRKNPNKKKAKEKNMNRKEKRATFFLHIDEGKNWMCVSVRECKWLSEWVLYMGKINLSKNEIEEKEYVQEEKEEEDNKMKKKYYYTVTKTTYDKNQLNKKRQKNISWKLYGDSFFYYINLWKK